MRRVLNPILMVLCALLVAGCLQVSTDLSYTLESGQTVQGNLLLFANNVTLEEGSQVTGSVWIPGANLIANGEVSGDIFLLAGNLDLGSTAAVSGDVMVVSGNINLTPEARVGGEVGYGVTPGFLTGLVVWICLLPLALVGLFLFLTTLAVYRGRRRGVRPARQSERPAGMGGSTVLFGIVLIGLGILFLVNNALGIFSFNLSWPWFFFIAGLAFFLLVGAGGSRLAFLAIPATLLTLMGLTFLYQLTFDHFESWAYAWALVAISGVGIGIWVMGLVNGSEDLMSTGRSLAALGLLIFIVAAIFFELVVNISGRSGDLAAGLFWPAAIILLGLLLLLAQLTRAGQRRA